LYDIIGAGNIYRIDQCIIRKCSIAFSDPFQGIITGSGGQKLIVLSCTDGIILSRIDIRKDRWGESDEIDPNPILAVSI